ncbi:MAG: DNA recombination protein RmuC [Halioglobus sp.]|nr:DNA recombination protein RmuC [Halioglobus sp.]
MTLNLEQLLVSVVVVATLLLIGLTTACWRAVSNRRALAARAQEASGLAAELAAALAQQHGQSAIVEQLHAQLGARAGELQGLQERYERIVGQLTIAREQSARLEVQQKERDNRHQEQLQLLNDARDTLKKDFEVLANRIFDDKGKSFTTTSRASLEDLLRPFREQIAGFQQRINEVHDKSLQGNAALTGEIEKLRALGLQMNTQASNLTSALKGDKKMAGNWGEAQLQRSLELAGLVEGEHFLTQAAFKDDAGKRKVPDVLILLPDGKCLVVDSKVSLVDYDRAVAANSDAGRKEALAAHVRAVRNHMDDLNIKDYANLPGISSPDFVLMFLPIEPAYIEAMKQSRDLYDEGYRKNVIMVAHTTLMPILRVVANLWMIDKSNREAREISDRAGAIYNQVCRVAERLEKLGNAMGTAQTHYNDTVTSLVGKQGLFGKVERFQQLSTKANKAMPTLQPIQNELEDGRLSGAKEERLPPNTDDGDSKIRALQPDSKH